MQIRPESFLDTQWVRLVRWKYTVALIAAGGLIGSGLVSGGLGRIFLLPVGANGERLREVLSQLGWGSAGLLICGYVLFFGVLVSVRLSTRPAAAVLALTAALVHHESHESRWRSGDLTHRGRLNVLLERAARQCEGLAHALRPGDAVTEAAARELTHGMAAEIRALKVWVLHPGPFTYTDLACRLGRAIELAADNRWAEMPRRPPQPGSLGPSRGRRIAWAAVGTALVALAVAAGVWGAQFGVVGGAMVVVAATLALLALVNAGLSLAPILEAKAAVDKLRS